MVNQHFLFQHINYSGTSSCNKPFAAYFCYPNNTTDWLKKDEANWEIAEKQFKANHFSPGFVSFFKISLYYYCILLPHLWCTMPCIVKMMRTLLITISWLKWQMMWKIWQLRNTSVAVQLCNKQSAYLEKGGNVAHCTSSQWFTSIKSSSFLFCRAQYGTHVHIITN